MTLTNADCFTPHKGGISRRRLRYRAPHVAAGENPQGRLDLTGTGETQMKPGGTRQRLVLSIALLSAATLLADFAAAGGSFAIRNGTIAGGGGSGASGCYALVGTIGEATSGTTSNGEFTITSGFPATISDGGEAIPVGDHIFGNGFEGTGGCTP
jgi:hypothetical protein